MQAVDVINLILVAKLKIVFESESKNTELTESCAQEIRTTRNEIILMMALF